MLNATPRQQSRFQPPPAIRIPTICVVDPTVESYHDWQDAADLLDVQLRIVTSAEEALRLARNQSIDLWVVNVTLPGLTGYELCTMLKTRSTHTPVYLVANEYSPSTEQAAWQARATMFGVKPAHTEWLTSWVHQRQAPRGKVNRDGTRLDRHASEPVVPK